MTSPTPDRSNDNRTRPSLRFSPSSAASSTHTAETSGPPPSLSSSDCVQRPLNDTQSWTWSPAGVRTAPRRRQRVWRFTGHVHYATGAHGEWLRGELATVIHDLLAWAADKCGRAPSDRTADLERSESAQGERASPSQTG